MTSAAPGRSCTEAVGGDEGTDAVGIQLVRLRRSMDAVRARVLQVGGHGLEGSGLAVLHHLTTDGPTRVSGLAELLGLDPSTTSRHVATLERTGHVERVPDPDDGRAGLVRATDLGRTAFEDTRALRNRLIAWALQDWAPDEVAAFAATLSRFNDALAGGERVEHLRRTSTDVPQETR